MVALCACSGAGGGFAAEQQGDIASRREVRSIAAELATVLRLDAQGRSTALYMRKMTDQARKRLQDIDESAGDKDALLHRAIADAYAGLDKRDPDALRALSERLFALAGPHGPDR
jgi:hypothetical protein